jgi:hypothetical protein
MKLYEIINPSDPYTFRAPDIKIAALVVILLGRGAYGAVTKDGTEKTPVLGGWDEWLADQGLADGNIKSFLDAHEWEVLEAMESVLIGSFSDRQDVEAALVNMPKDTHEAYLAARHDRRRSSMNDIGKTAQAIAAAMRITMKKGTPNETSQL